MAQQFQPAVGGPYLKSEIDTTSRVESWERQLAQIHQGIRDEIEQAQKEGREPHTAGLLWGAGVLSRDIQTMKGETK